MMECPVCYSNIIDTCQLLCGHSFCISCIKKWYLKSGVDEATCPMCRQKLYFKGMYKYWEKWEEERHENQLEIIYGNCFDSVLENLGDMGELYDMEMYFNKYKNEFAYEDIEYYVLDPFFEYKKITYKYLEYEFEVPKNTKFLFVSDYNLLHFIV